MSAWKQHLPDNTINEIYTGLTQAGLSNQGTLDVLRGSLDNRFAGSLPGPGLPMNIRLLGELQAMNKVHNLRNGDVPLAQWLTLAITIAGDQQVASVLDRALLEVSEGAAPAPAARLDPRTTAGAGGPDNGGGAMNTNVEFEAMVAGSDETLSVKYLSAGLQAASSVFKLLVHRHVGGHPEFTTGDTPRLANGTGWMIAPGLIITNHHVVNARLRSVVVEPDATDQDLHLQSEHVRILYDYHEVDNPAHTEQTAVGALEAFDKRLDFAILRLPGGAPDRSPLKLRSRLVRKTLGQALGTRVNVLQHPNGDPMRLGFRDNFVTRGDEDLLSYLTDTSSGSSGSPVCDDAWNVAALHAGSESVLDQNIVLRGRKVKRQNFGIPVPTLMEQLERDHPILHAEIMAGQG